jgi:hypothetical protein
MPVGGVPLAAGRAAVIALNPFVLLPFVVNVHNDVLPVTLIVVGMALRSPIVSPALAIAAGLLKLPFILIAVLLCVDEPSRVRRWCRAAVIVAATAAGSALLGGASYLRAVQAHLHEQPESPSI